MLSVAVEVNATATRHISSRSASPAGDEKQRIIPLDETGGDASPAPAPVVVRPKSESPAATESDEEILIVESEVTVNGGGPADTAPEEDRSSPARNA